MDDFRSQLKSLIDAMSAEGQVPAFLIVDLDGADQIKKNRGAESLAQFHESAINAITSMTNGADAFTYGDERIVVILDGSWGRLQTFGLIQKLRRMVPMLGQSYDCFLMPECDVVEYEPARGLPALIAKITAPRVRPSAEELSA